MIYFFVLLALLLPTRGEAFSESLKQYITSLQDRVLLKGSPLTRQETTTAWQKFDEEVLDLLAQTENPTEEKLNTKTSKTQLSVVEKTSHEIEPIDLGTIEVQFYSLKNTKGDIWLALYLNDFGSKFSSTFHVFSKVNGKYRRISSFEDVKGPWDTQKMTSTIIQIQKIPTGRLKFSSYHLSEDRNRSQIVWDNLKPRLWYPEVDFHRVGDTRVNGRGPGMMIR